MVSPKQRFPLKKKNDRQEILVQCILGILLHLLFLNYVKFRLKKVIDGSLSIQLCSQPDINLSQVRTDLLREKQTIYLEQAKQPYEIKKTWNKNINFYRFLFSLIPVIVVTMKILGTSITFNFRTEALIKFARTKTKCQKWIEVFVFVYFCNHMEISFYFAENILVFQAFL